MFLDSRHSKRSHPRRSRLHGHDLLRGYGGRDYELLDRRGLEGIYGERYGYGREGPVRLDEPPLLRRRRNDVGELDSFGGGFLGGVRGAPHSGLRGLSGGLPVAGGPGSLGWFGPLDRGSGGGVGPVLGGGLGGGLGPGGLRGGLSSNAGLLGRAHGMGGLGSRRMEQELRSLRGLRGMRGIEGMRGMAGMEGFDGGFDNGLGGGLEDRFSAMRFGGPVPPMPSLGRYYDAPHSRGHFGECLLSRPRPEPWEYHATRSPRGSNESSRAGSVDGGGYDLHAMDRPRTPYGPRASNYRPPYVEDYASNLDELEMQRRGAMDDILSEEGHWYDEDLLDAYLM